MDRDAGCHGKGVSITPENLKISDRASLLLPWHRELDGLEEARLADKKYGSTKQGIAPFYSDKYQKKTVMAGELLYPDKLWDHLEGILEWKNLTLTKVYGAKPYTMDDLKAWVADYGEKIKPFICDTGAFLRQAQAGQEHPVRGPAGLPAGSGLRHLSLYHLLQPHRRLRPRGLRPARRPRSTRWWAW